MFEFNRELGYLTNKNGQRYELTPVQSRILNALSRNPNRLMTRESLAQNLRIRDGSEDVEPYAVNPHISQIRLKIGQDVISGDQSIIKTMKDTGIGAGYMLLDASRLSSNISGTLVAGEETDVS